MVNHIDIGKYDSRYGVDPIHRQLVRGYTELVTGRIETGWSCHLLTVLFAQLPGNRAVVINRMKDELQRVYSTLVTRVHRKPRTASPDELPILIGAADLPVYKRNRSSAPTVHCNGGLHFHALLLVPPASRLEESVDEHFRVNDDLYRGRMGLIRTIHVRPVVDGYERVVDYVFKTVLRGRVSYDEGILLLPRSNGELTSACYPGVFIDVTLIGTDEIERPSCPAASLRMAGRR
jgi:hypothetical protein